MNDDAMERLLAAVERQLGAEWTDAIGWLRDNNKLDDIYDRLRNGDFAGAIQGVDDAAKRFAAKVDDAYKLSGQKTAAWLDKKVTNKLISWDGTNARAVAWAESNKMDLVREITAEQQIVLRNIVADGVRDGINPRVVARDIRDSIGLTAKQEAHVRSYRRALETGDLHNALGRELRDGRSDRTLRRALADGATIPPKQIAKMVERYRRNWIAYRSTVIARTEALRAVHQGNEELFQQAVESGQVEENVLVRRWSALRDGKTRRSHRAMHGQERSLGEKFRTGNGYELRYPGDPSAPAKETVQCRCVLTTRYVSVPAGFEAGGMPLRRGVPKRDDIDGQKLHVVSAISLRDKLIALPGGGASEARLQSIRDAWSKGTKLPPVQLAMLPDGSMFVSDGRHRLLVALEQDRDVLVRFDTAVAEIASSTVPLVKWRWLRLAA